MHKFNIIEKSSFWSKYLIITLTMSFLLSMSMNMETAILPIFAQSVGGNNSVGGTIMGIMSLSVLLFRSFFGNLLDTKGRKITVFLGLIIFALGSFFYAWVLSLGMVLFFRFIQGIGFSAQNTGTGTIVLDIVPKERLGEGLGYVGTSNTLATAIGPSLALYIVSKYNYSFFFIMSAVFGLLASIVLLFLNYEKQNSVKKDKSVDKDNGYKNKKKKMQ
ncbi:MAG: MFS transporter [Clostridiaceae bacterium]